jgi:ABC-type glycerol-3-phosphate transport system permease component
MHSLSLVWRRNVGKISVYLTLLFVAVTLIGVPIGWVVATALMDQRQIFAWPPSYIPDPFHWENFSLLMDRFPFVRFALNSTLICAVNIVGNVFSCSIVAYAFARLRFPGRDLLFLLVLSGLMIPNQILMIPQFVLFSTLGWTGSYLPLTVPSFFASSASGAFFIFLMRQYIMTIPRELDEAARIDGASTWDIYRRIVMPLCIPPITLITVLTFLWTWNDFVGPLIYINNSENFTIQLGLATLRDRFHIEWNLIMAGAVLAMLPPAIIYFLAQRYIIGGIASVGIKG